MNKLVIAMVGGGPRSVYALERLLALLKNTALSIQVEIHIFEANGRYGAGVAHSDCQNSCSYLNRTADQIAFAADESVTNATNLLPAPLRMTFIEWCQHHWRESGDSTFNLQAQDVPRRYLHGLALRDYFERYAAELRQIDGVSVTAHPEQVTSLSSDGQAFRLVSPRRPAGLVAHHILFITGHTPCRSSRKSTEGRFARNFNYIPWAYPLEDNFTERQIPARNTIALLGMGLTAIDICLFLTEARGGTFIRQQSGKLSYQPSGKEPRNIIALSRSGKIYSTRPRNEKFSPKQFYTGQFFTLNAVSLLRQHCGKPVLVRYDIRHPQLDFERDLFPLIVLEMAWVYYHTLLGERWLSRQLPTVNAVYQDFLSMQEHRGAQDIDRLLAPLQKNFDSLVERLCPARGEVVNATKQDAVVAWHVYHTLTDDDVDTAQAPFLLRALEPEKTKWQHSPRLAEHKFDWRAIFTPFANHSSRSPSQRKQQILTWLSKDLDAARQGNIRNPLKACCDSVWRDLRTVFSSACDFGGLTPASQKNFMQQWLPHYNRLSNGASIEVMEKIEALVRQGIVLLPATAKISSQTYGNTFFLRYGGKTRQVNHLACARIHPFDARYQVNPLYPDMLANGIIQLWENRRSHNEVFIPGAVRVTPEFHPVMRDGTVDDRLTFLGSPAEGACFFTNAAARPAANSSVLGIMHHWAEALVKRLSHPQSDAQPAATGEGRV